MEATAAEGPRSLRRADLAIALAAASLAVALNVGYVYRDLGLVHSPDAILEGDHHRYLSLASGPVGEPGDDRAREAPFCWRILVPWLVARAAAAGARPEPTFYAVSLLGLTVFLAALFLHGRQRGLTTGVSLLGVSVAALLPGGVRWYVYQYPMPDPLCLALVGLAVVAIEARRDAWLIPIGMAALASRESYLLVIPYHFLHRLQRGSLREALRAALLYNALPLAVFLGIRLSIEAVNSHRPLEIAQDIARFRWRRLWVNQAYFTTVGSLGVLLPALLALPARLIRALPRELAGASLVLGAYASLLLANNTDRLLMYALPALVPAAMAQLAELGRRTRVPLAAAGPVLLAVQAYHYDQTLYFQKLGASIFQPANLGVTYAVGALWLALQASRIASRGIRPRR
jgi:hypothetical protein